MKRYKDTPWWWYIVIMGISFVFGLVVVLKSDVGLGAGGYVSALVIGALIGPFVSPANLILNSAHTTTECHSVLPLR